jgi:hypothetical protein
LEEPDAQAIKASFHHHWDFMLDNGDIRLAVEKNQD